MNNYYEFNNLSIDKESSNVFKAIFNGQDYDEFYYSCLSLIEQLNNIKIIFNILKDRDKNE